MRVATLTMPINDNSGQALPFVHSVIQHELCRAYGGYTASDAQGGWIDSETGKAYHESVKIYSVAANWTPEMESQFRLLAARCGALGAQIAVYLQFDGNAEIIAPDTFIATYLQGELAAKQAA